MKICAVISEYNPFHNGHKYLLDQARELSGADLLFVVMSGNFTQRGEAALLDKYTRAKHAVLAGTDAVIELPTLFATAPAELFAGGAVRLVASIPDATALAFGCEDDNATLLNNTAKILTDEPKSFKRSLKEKLKSGMSFVKARTETLSEMGVADVDLLSKPNNILGFEYTKALARFGSSIRTIPVKRTGNEHNDDRLYENFTSASSIRANVFSEDKKTIKLLKSVMPDYAYADLANVKKTDFESLVMYSLHAASASDLRKIIGCTEGLENRMKALLKDTFDYRSLVDKMTSKRYTSSRLKRIMLSAFLDIPESLIRDCEENDLYLKVLALKKDDAERILSALSKSEYPVITRKKDAEALRGRAKKCFEKDIYANDLFNFMTKTATNEYYTMFV